MGRRDMMAGAFALAAVAGNPAPAAIAAEERFDKVFGKEMGDDKLPAAGDFTRYDKVVTKKRSPTEVTEASAKPGAVESQPYLVPGVVALSAAVTAGVPYVLSTGQTAKDEQDKRRR